MLMEVDRTDQILKKVFDICAVQEIHLFFLIWCILTVRAWELVHYSGLIYLLGTCWVKLTPSSFQ